MILHSIKMMQEANFLHILKTMDLMKAILKIDSFILPGGGGLCSKTIVKLTTGTARFKRKAPLFGLIAIGAIGSLFSSEECSHTSMTVLLEMNF